MSLLLMNEAAPSVDPLIILNECGRSQMHLSAWQLNESDPRCVSGYT